MSASNERWPKRPCLSENELLDYLDGRASPDLREALIAHVNDCAECRELLVTAVRTQPSIRETLELPSGCCIAGRYQVLDVVGVGGMSVVYAAEDLQLRRKVALKLVRAGGGSADTGLLGEAHAMARLSHPNVVAVYDAGQHDGRVFVAMDYVDGVSIRAWLKEHRRSWRAIVRAYVQAGTGLAAAHDAGLVHRDFKPDNVLVWKDRRVQVADFGLARYVASAAQELAAPESDVTPAQLPSAAPSRWAGTPAYMAPEQLRNEPVDARADIFSFGIALFESLAGELPFGAPGLRGSLDDSAFREPAKLGRIPRAVRAVVRRCLRSRPDARFTSMHDVVRGLERAMRRRSDLLLGAALFTATLLAVTVGYGAHARRARDSAVCKGAEAKWGGVWDAARKTSIRETFLATGKPFATTAWNETERGLDAYVADWTRAHVDACEATRIRREQSEQVLDRKMECLSERFAHVRALTGLLASATADVVQNAAGAVEALPKAASCNDLQRLPALRTHPSADQGRYTDLVEKLALASAHDDAGDFRSVVAIASDALTEARKLGDVELEARALYRLGRAQCVLGDRECEPLLEQAAAAAEAAGDAELIARAWVGIGCFAGYPLQKPTLGEGFLRYARQAIERLGGDDELEADRLRCSGLLSDLRGDYPEARDRLSQAIRQLGDRPGHELAAGRILQDLGVVSMETGDMAMALSQTEAAVAKIQIKLGPEHPRTGVGLQNVAFLFMCLGRFPDALATAKRAQACIVGGLGSGNLNYLEARITEAEALVAEQRPREAEPIVTETITTLEASDRATLSTYADSRRLLGQIARMDGHLAAARKHLLAALSVYGTSGTMSAVGESQLGQVELDGKDYGAAKEHYDRALRVCDQLGISKSFVRARPLLGLGLIAHAQGDPSKAVEELGRGETASLPPDGNPFDLAALRFALAKAVAGTDPARARGLAEQALATFAGDRYFEPQEREVEAWIEGRGR